MAVNERTIVTCVHIYAVLRSLCKDTKFVMYEICVERYRIRGTFNSLLISLVPSLSIYIRVLTRECFS